MPGAGLRTGTTHDAFARARFHGAKLLLGVSAMRSVCTPFCPSSWAHSFPLAAVTIVTPAMAEGLHSDVPRILAARLLALVSIVVAALVVRTSIAALCGGICVAERVRSIQPRSKASAP